MVGARKRLLMKKTNSDSLLLNRGMKRKNYDFKDFGRDRLFRVSTNEGRKEGREQRKEVKEQRKERKKEAKEQRKERRSKGTKEGSKGIKEGRK